MYHRHIAIWYLTNCFIFIGATWLLLQVFNNHEVLSAALSAKLDEDRIEEIVDFRIKMGWIGLCLIPIVLAIKYAFIYFPFLVGASVEDIALQPRDIFKGIMQYDFIFALPLLIRYIHFGCLRREYALTDMQLCPLSLASLTGDSDLPSYLLYPMQGVNVFELVFIILLVIHFKRFFIKPGQSAVFVCKYYILPQLIWYSLVSLLSLL